MNLYERPRSANKFYELFLVNYGGFLVDIPILIAGVGDYNDGLDMTQWTLVRRFFLFDTISGIQDQN